MSEKHCPGPDMYDLIVKASVIADNLLSVFLDAKEAPISFPTALTELSELRAEISALFDRLDSKHIGIPVSASCIPSTADARLIAAVPEMLKLLRGCSDVHCVLAPWPPQPRQGTNGGCRCRMRVSELLGRIDGGPLI